VGVSEGANPTHTVLCDCARFKRNKNKSIKRQKYLGEKRNLKGDREMDLKKICIKGASFQDNEQ